MKRVMDTVAAGTPTYLVAALTCLIVSAGCGYTIKSTLDPKYQSIHVAVFENQGNEYDLQAPLANALTRKFINDGRLRSVTRNAADLLLEGVLTDYSLRGLTFDRDDEVTQFLTVISAGVRLTDLRTGEVLWEDAGMTGESSYSTRAVGSTSDRLRGNASAFLQPVRSFQTDEENLAAAEALEQLASDIYYRTVEPW